jgi:hypothetical protein
MRLIRSRFKLFLTCPNCLREGKRVLEVPDEEDAPRYVEELLESEFLRAQRFSCHCGGHLSTLTAVTELEQAAA